VALADGSIDREALAKIIFGSDEHRRWLNSISHWRIGVELAKKLAYSYFICPQVVVLDAPLLFESGLARICSATVAISVPPETQMTRLMARDFIDEAFAKEKIESQMATEEKVARADLVLDNAGELEGLAARVDTLMQKIRLLPVPWWMDRRKTIGLVLSLLVAYHLLLR